ncbi:MAG: sugar phosphate isomerase/epimerase family protein [Anaerolineae bacterium]
MIKIAATIGTPDLRTETLALYSGDVATAVRKVAALGYDGVEFMMRDPAQLDGIRLRRWLDEHGLHLAAICTGHVYSEDGLGLVSPDTRACRQAMQRMKSIVDFAATYFERGTIVTIGRSRGPGYADDPERSLAEMETAFGELADYAAPRGVRLVLEPINIHQARYIHTTQEGIAMVKRVNRPNFGLMLDVYHMNIEDVDIYNSFREADGLCWFVHFSDNNRHWPGSAHLDFEQIVRVLNEIGYSGYVSTEILPWPDPDTAARATIESLRRYIPGSIRKMGNGADIHG